MGWIKGMPRKGHVNKNGKAHAKWGAAHERVGATLRTFRIARVSPAVFDDAEPVAVLIHGERPGRAVVQPCPTCGFAYADGGYCEDCGWSETIVRMPYGTVQGKKIG